MTPIGVRHHDRPQRAVRRGREPCCRCSTATPIGRSALPLGSTDIHLSASAIDISLQTASAPPVHRRAPLELLSILLIPYPAIRWRTATHATSRHSAVRSPSITIYIHPSHPSYLAIRRRTATHAISRRSAVRSLSITIHIHPSHPFHPAIRWHTATHAISRRFTVHSPSITVLSI